MLTKLSPVIEPRPNKDPIHPPKKAPIIPINIVIIKPPGSLPGIINFAINPAINPNTIQAKIPIIKILKL